MRLALLPALSVVLLSSLASAGSKTEPDVVAVITERLVQPLAAKESERSKFSRARPAPSERRVRITDTSPQRDSAGEAFVSFALDERHGWSDAKDESAWSKATITGCVYTASGSVFIQRGEKFHPAAAAIGKKTKAAPERTCHAVATVSVR